MVLLPALNIKVLTKIELVAFFAHLYTGKYQSKTVHKERLQKKYHDYCNCHCNLFCFIFCGPMIPNLSVPLLFQMDYAKHKDDQKQRE